MLIKKRKPFGRLDCLGASFTLSLTGDFRFFVQFMG